MKTITRKIFVLTFVMCGIIFSHAASAACTAPTQSTLTVSGLTSTSAILNWGAVVSSAGYNVQYKLTTSGSWTTVTNVSTNTLTISSLSPASVYTWQVQNRCNSSGSNVSGYTAAPGNFTTLSVCGVPTGLSSTGITTSAATLNWTAISGATGYNIRYRIVGSPTWTSTTSTSNTKSISSLTASSNYEFQVQTNCGSSNLSAFSGSSTFTTLTPVCNVPTGLNTTGITSTDATLNWTAVSGAVGYIVTYTEVSTLSTFTINATTASVTVTSLNVSSNYEWQVQTDCGNSSFSAISPTLAFSTLATACSIPSGLSTTGITASEATMEWTTVAGASGYNIQYRIVGAPTWTQSSSWTLSSAATAALSVALLTPSSNYEWQVQTDCGNSNFSAFSSTLAFSTSGSACAVPVGINTIGITTTSATIEWNGVVNALAYNAQYRIVGVPSWTSLNTSDKTIALSSLLPSTQYEWQVRTDCGNSTFSAFSDLVKFTTSAVPVCNNLPVSLTAVGITHTSATLSWSVSGNESDATGFEIQYRQVGAPSWTSVPSLPLSTTISSLNPSVNYEWQVRTDCGNSLFSAFSSAANFTTLSHAPVNTTSQFPLATPNPNDPLTWLTVLPSSGNNEADAQIVIDWLIAHGCIVR